MMDINDQYIALADELETLRAENEKLITSTHLIEEAIAEYFGEKCPDYDADCICCKAWMQLESIKARG